MDRKLLNFLGHRALERINHKLDMNPFLEISVDDLEWIEYMNANGYSEESDNNDDDTDDDTGDNTDDDLPIPNLPYHQSSQPTAGLKLSRKKFSQWYLKNDSENAAFHDTFLWSGEALFTPEGMFTYHQDQKRDWDRPAIPKTSWKLKVWIGLIGSDIIGPYFFNPKCDWSVEKGRKVNNYLNARFPKRWIAKGGPIKWPKISYDLTPINYCLWSECYRVYETPCPDLNTMKLRLRELFVNEPFKNCMLDSKDKIIGNLKTCVENEGNF